MEQAIFVIFLKAGQMSISLILLQLTYHWLNSKDFVYFNSLMFYSSMTLVLLYPIFVSMWHGIDSKSSKFMTTGLIASIIYYIFLGIYFLNLIEPQGLTIKAAIFCSVLVYGTVKVLDRFIFIHYITEKKYFKAYFYVYMFLGLELLSYIFLGFFEKAYSFYQRVFFSTLLSLVLVSFIFFRELFDRNYAKKIKICQSIYETLSFIKKEKKGWLLVYMLALTVTSSLDRALMPYFDIDAQTAAEYLLLFSYATAIYTLFSALFDWLRPKVRDAIKDGHSGHTSESILAIFLILTGFISAGVAGFYFFIHFQLIEINNYFRIWIFIIIGYCLMSILVIIQLPDIFCGRYRLISLLWIIAVAAKVLCIVYFKNNLYALAASNAVGTGCVLTLMLSIKYIKKLSDNL